MTLLPLIAAIEKEEHQEIEVLLRKQPALVNVTDEHGNTPLHYAVAQQDLESIKLLSTIPGLQPERKNNYGESALEWYRNYANTSSWQKDDGLKNMGVFSLSLQINKEKNINYICDFFKVAAITYARFSEGDNVLHMSIRYGQLSFVRTIVNRLDNKRDYRLFYDKNFTGDTPLSLAKKLQQQGRPNAQDILCVIQQKLKTVPDSLELQPTIEKLPEIILDLDKVTQLKKYFDKEITQEDWQDINPLLPTLVTLCYFTCCLSILQCNELLNSAKTKNITWQTFQNYSPDVAILKRQAKKLMDRFLLRTDKKIISYLREQIIHIADYLANILLQGKVNQVIHLVDSFEGHNNLPDLGPKQECIACVSAANKIIYKFIGRHYLPENIMTILHESSHIALQSQDFVYYKPTSKELKQVIHLPVITEIPFMFDSKTSLQKEIFKLQYSLENQASNMETWMQWICRHNADTISFLITLLSANYCGFIIYDSIFSEGPNPQVGLLDGRDAFLSSSHIKHFTIAQKDANLRLLQPINLLVAERIRENDILFKPIDMSEIEEFLEAENLPRLAQNWVASPDICIDGNNAMFNQRIGKVYEFKHSLNSLSLDSLVC